MLAQEAAGSGGGFGGAMLQDEGRYQQKQMRRSVDQAWKCKVARNSPKVALDLVLYRKQLSVPTSAEGNSINRIECARLTQTSASIHQSAESSPVPFSRLRM